MKERTPRWLAGAMVVGTFGLVSAGCGSSDSSSSTSSTTSASAARIDEAVETCNTKAQTLNEAGAAALQAACETVGDNVRQALATGGAQLDQALAQAADSCDATASQLPAGQIHDTLTALCDAVGTS